MRKPQECREVEKSALTCKTLLLRNKISVVGDGWIDAMEATWCADISEAMPSFAKTLGLIRQSPAYQASLDKIHNRFVAQDFHASIGFNWFKTLCAVLLFLVLHSYIILLTVSVIFLILSLILWDSTSWRLLKLKTNLIMLNAKIARISLASYTTWQLRMRRRESSKASFVKCRSNTQLSRRGS